MNPALDPLLLDRLDESRIEDDDQVDYSIVEICPVCGEDVIREADGAMLDLYGDPHQCPEVGDA